MTKPNRPVPYRGPVVVEIECYPGCPCGKCQQIRKTAHDARWATLGVVDRVRESLLAKVEGDSGRMPERGMFNCADIAELVRLVSHT